VCRDRKKVWCTCAVLGEEITNFQPGSRAWEEGLLVCCWREIIVGYVEDILELGLGWD